MFYNFNFDIFNSMIEHACHLCKVAVEHRELGRQETFHKPVKRTTAPNC